MVNKVIIEKLPNLEKEMSIQVQEASRTPNRHDQNRTSPRQIVVNILTTENKERILKSAKEKCHITYKGNP
jgi:hypothetical protein